MPSNKFADLATKQDDLIRKALDWSLFIAPETTALPATLTGADGSLTALTGFTDGGLMTDEGLRFARAVDTSTVSSGGRSDPSRTDVTRDEETVAVDFQETNLTTIQLFTGADLSNVVIPASGELRIPKPARPAQRYYRAIALAVDDSAAGEIYIARILPRVKVTNYADQAWAKGDTPIQWGVTLTAYVDDAVGYSLTHAFGGPGWVALLDAMGFPAPGA